MIIRKERIWQIQPWNIWEKQVQSGAKEVFLPPWWILDSNGISPMLGHLYNTSWLQVCTLWTVNDVLEKKTWKDPQMRLQGSEGSFQGIFYLERPFRPNKILMDDGLTNRWFPELPDQLAAAIWSPSIAHFKNFVCMTESMVFFPGVVAIQIEKSTVRQLQIRSSCLFEEMQCHLWDILWKNYESSWSYGLHEPTLAVKNE